MRFFRFFPVFLWFLLSASACDDGSKKKNPAVNPSLEQSTIAVGPVVYSADPAGLTASITVHVVDDAGSPLSGIAVMPASDRETDSFDPPSAVTGANGDAVFSMRGAAFGTAVVSAFVSTADAVDVTKDPILAARPGVNFDVSLQVIPLEASYTWEKGDFTLRATLSDSAGPVAGATLTVTSEEPDLAFADDADSVSVQTNASGSASFHAFTGRTGTLSLSFELEGVEGAKTVNVPFEGPSAGGTVYMGQPYPAGFVSARAAAMALNLTSASAFNVARPLLGEVTSESVCPCPEPSAFRLRLPIMPPEELLVADSTRQIRYNYFPVVVYDDIDNDHLWDSGETLLGARMSAGILYYAKPDGANPQGPLGWSLVANLAETPQVLDWEFFNSSLDAWIRRAPLEELHLHGVITEAQAGDRILFAVVDPFAMTGYAAPGPWVASMIDGLQASPDHMQPVLDAPAPEGVNVPYELVLGAPQLTSAQDDAWRITWTSPQGNQVDGFLVAAFLYADTNGNGRYDAGETIRGTLRSAAAGTSLVMYYVAVCDNHEVISQPDGVGVHRGYNLLETAQAMEIRQVEFAGGTYAFTTGANLPNAFQDTPFRIVRGPMTGNPVATGTFSTAFDGFNIINVPSFNCQGCSSVQTGDRFVILQPHDPASYRLLDWADLDFSSSVP